jgi:outer membrane murein-binding lipoprotein Lpp
MKAWRLGTAVLVVVTLTGCAATLVDKLAPEKREYAAQQQAFMSQWGDLQRHARVAERLWQQFRFGLNPGQRQAYEAFNRQDDQASLSRLWYSLSDSQKGTLARWHMESRICRRLYTDLTRRDRQLSERYARMSDRVNQYRRQKPDSQKDPAQRSVLDPESYAEQSRRRLLASFKPGPTLFNRLAARLDLMR